MNKIGTVELLRTRIYALDAESRDTNRTEVVVEPGTYDLYRDGPCVFWLMRGKLNRRGFWRGGDGMFLVYESDSASDIEVQFPSRRFGDDEFAELLAGPECTEGPDQRLRVEVTADVQS